MCAWCCDCGPTARGCDECSGGSESGCRYKWIGATITGQDRGGKSQAGDLQAAGALAEPNSLAGPLALLHVHGPNRCPFQGVARDNTIAMTPLERFEVWFRAAELPTSLDHHRSELRLIVWQCARTCSNCASAPSPHTSRAAAPQLTCARIVCSAFWLSFSAHCHYCSVGAGAAVGGRTMRRAQWTLFMRALLPVALFEQLGTTALDLKQPRSSGLRKQCSCCAASADSWRDTASTRSMRPRHLA